MENVGMIENWMTQQAMEIKRWKIGLFLFNISIWLSGCVVLVFGAWLLLEPSSSYLFNLFVDDSSPQDTICLISYCVLGYAAMILLVGTFGCRASMRENQCMLGIYMGMMIPMIAMELTGFTAAGYIARKTISGLEERLTDRLPEYYGHDSTSNIPFSHSLDFTQYKFNCCGIHGDGDYNNTAWWRDGQYSGNKRNVPLTCCVLKNPEIKNSGSPMSVVTRVFHKDNEKPWLHPQPEDENACQHVDPEAHKEYRHEEGCLEKVQNWMIFESFKFQLLGTAIMCVKMFGVGASAMVCRLIRQAEGY